MRTREDTVLLAPYGMGWTERWKRGNRKEINSYAVKGIKEKSEKFVLHMGEDGGSPHVPNRELEVTNRG